MDWRTVASAQAGVISHGQIVGTGVAATAIPHMIVDRRLIALTRGIYLVHGAPTSRRARLWSAVLATRGTLGFATAAEVWGIIGSQDLSAVVHVIVPQPRQVDAPRWVRLHRVPVTFGQVVTRDGLPITSRSWTLCDYLPSLREGASVTLLDRALQQGWIAPADIAARLKGYPKRYGKTRLRKLLDITSDGAAAKSERLFHGVLRRAGLKGWKPNYPVWHNGAVIATVDVAIPARRLALEVDGMAFHIEPERFQGDRTRQNKLVAAGWTVLRFTWADIEQRPSYVVEAIRALAA